MVDALLAVLVGGAVAGVVIVLLARRRLCLPSRRPREGLYRATRGVEACLVIPGDAEKRASTLGSIGRSVSQRR